MIICDTIKKVLLNWGKRFSNKLESKKDFFRQTDNILLKKRYFSIDGKYTDKKTRKMEVNDVYSFISPPQN